MINKKPDPRAPKAAAPTESAPAPMPEPALAPLLAALATPSVVEGRLVSIARAVPGDTALPVMLRVELLNQDEAKAVLEALRQARGLAVPKAAPKFWRAW